jgi:hypothetical protein
MKTLWITHDLGEDKSGFIAVNVTLSQPDIYERDEDESMYLRINEDHPNDAGVKCMVCSKIIEFGWENFDYPRQSVCDNCCEVVNP